MTQESEGFTGQDRRKRPRVEDRFFRTMIGINVIGWIAFVAALLVFHYARPELITGVQEYWGIQGREEWSASLSIYLIGLLCVCCLVSIIVLWMKRYRNRRNNDHFGANGFVLLVVAGLSLAALYFELS